MLEKTFFFLTILFLPTQLGLHFWPDFSYIFSLKIDYLSPTLYFWDLICLSLIYLWLGKKILVKDFSGLATGPVALLLSYLLSQLLSLFGAVNLGAGLFRFEQLIIVGLFGIYISSQRFEKIKNPLFLGLLLSVSFEALLAIAQFIKASSVGFWILGERTFSISTPQIAKFNFLAEVVLRPYGTFSHPNVLAGFLITIIPLLFVLYEARRKYRLIFRASLVLGMVVTFLTFSRSAIFLSLLQGLFFLKPQIKKIYILSLLIISPFLFIRFSSTFSFDALSFLRREELAQIAINMFLKNPIIGVGLNNFINVLSRDATVSGLSRFLQPVHNIFLLALSETGLLGLLGFLLFCLAPIYQLFKTRIEFFSKALLFIWGAIFFLGIFDHYFLTLPQGLRLLFLIWGLSVLKR